MALAQVAQRLCASAFAMDSSKGTATAPRSQAQKRKRKRAKAAAPSDGGPAPTPSAAPGNDGGDEGPALSKRARRRRRQRARAAALAAAAATATRGNGQDVSVGVASGVAEASDGATRGPGVKTQQGARQQRQRAGSAGSVDSSSRATRGSGFAGAGRPSFTAAFRGSGVGSSASGGLLNKFEKKLHGAQFRWLNEQLYTSTGDQAFEAFQQQNSLFDAVRVWLCVAV